MPSPYLTIPLRTEAQARDLAHYKLDRELKGSLALLEQDRLNRIRWHIANLYGPDRDLARSTSIAIARRLLGTKLEVLAEHFGCKDAEEAAGHCNRIENSEFRTKYIFESSITTLGHMLGLGTDWSRPCDKEKQG